MESENGVPRSIIDELHSSDIQRGNMEGESGVTPSISHDLPLWISKEIKCKVKVVLHEVSLMNFIFRLSKEIKWKVKVVLLEVSMMILIFWISRDIKRKLNVVLLEVSLMKFQS